MRIFNFEVHDKILFFVLDSMNYYQQVYAYYNIIDNFMNPYNDPYVNNH